MNGGYINKVTGLPRVVSSKLNNTALSNGPYAFQCPTLSPPTTFTRSDAFPLTGGGITYNNSTWLSYGLRVISTSAYFPGEMIGGGTVVPSEKYFVKLDSVYKDCPYMVDSVFLYSGGKGQCAEYRVDNSGTEIPPNYVIHLRHAKAANLWYADNHVSSATYSMVKDMRRPGSGTVSSTPISCSY